MAFAKDLAEVTTDVDDDEDPLDSIKDYGKELSKAFTLNGIAEASKIARIVKKAWKPKKTKLKTQSSYKTWGKRTCQGGPPPAAAVPVVPLYSCNGPNLSSSPTMCNMWSYRPLRSNLLPLPPGTEGG